MQVQPGLSCLSAIHLARVVGVYVCSRGGSRPTVTSLRTCHDGGGNLLEVQAARLLEAYTEELLLDLGPFSLQGAGGGGESVNLSRRAWEVQAARLLEAYTEES